MPLGDVPRPRVALMCVRLGDDSQWDECSIRVLPQVCTMIELHFSATPDCWKVSIMLEESGLPYTAHEVSDRSDLSAINPFGSTPVLIDRDVDHRDNVIVFESGAMLLHLAEKCGRLLPLDSEGRSLAIQWLFWQVGGLGPALKQNDHFRLHARETIPYALERYGKEALRLYGILEKQLGNTCSFIVGNYSIADVACFPWIITHRAHGISLGDYPNVRRWFGEVRRRPQVLRGLGVTGGIKALRRPKRSVSEEI